MELEEYLLSDEEIHHQSSVEYGDFYVDGDLACTDHRLVLVRDSGTLDISLDSVEEISFRDGALPWEYVGWLVLFVLIGLLGWLATPAFLPGNLFLPVGLFSAIATVVAVYEIIRRRLPALEVKTGTREHVFWGEGLSEFPNEIRQFEADN